MLEYLFSKSLLKFENYREGVGYLHRTLSLAAGRPLGRLGNDAYSFLVEGCVNTTENDDVADRTVGIYRELQRDTTLDSVFLRDFRINELAVDPL